MVSMYTYVGILASLEFSLDIYFQMLHNTKVTNKFSEWKQVHVGMEPSKTNHLLPNTIGRGNASLHTAIEMLSAVARI